MAEEKAKILPRDTEILMNTPNQIIDAWQEKHGEETYYVIRRIKETNVIQIRLTEAAKNKLLRVLGAAG